MSGKRLSEIDRRFISGQRRYVKRIRENEYLTFGNNVDSDKQLRAYARIGK